jgi:hypothetical protein
VLISYRESERKKGPDKVRLLLLDSVCNFVLQSSVSSFIAFLMKIGTTHLEDFSCVNCMKEIRRIMQ